MRFDWDERKAAANRLKPGVAFEEAITAFGDPFALVAPDPRHSTAGEQRTWLIGAADTAVVVVVYTIREGEVLRIISARRASRKERKRYEEARGVPV